MHFCVWTPYSYPTEYFDGRGIIMAAGGKYIHDAMTTIDMIRKLNCSLRIQVWYMGADEMAKSAQAWFSE
jgi:hypothetical protein